MNSIAIGEKADANADRSHCLWSGGKREPDTDSIAFGRQAEAEYRRSIVIGADSLINAGLGAIVIGGGTQARGATNSVVILAEARQTQGHNSVFIGDNIQSGAVRVRRHRTNPTGIGNSSVTDVLRIGNSLASLKLSLPTLRWKYANSHNAGTWGHEYRRHGPSEQ